MTSCVSLTRALDSEPNMLSTDKAFSASSPFIPRAMQKALIGLQNDNVVQITLPDNILNNLNYDHGETCHRGMSVKGVLTSRVIMRNASIVVKAKTFGCKQNVNEICNNNPLFIHLLKNQYGNYYEKLN